VVDNRDRRCLHEQRRRQDQEAEEEEKTPHVRVPFVPRVGQREASQQLTVLL
jgi:hypothetical protein